MDIVVLSIQGIPPNAFVNRGAKRLGRAPLDVRVTKGDKPVRFVIHATGYQRAYPQLVPSHSRTLFYKLRTSDQPSQPNKGRRGQSPEDWPSGSTAG